jgi:hypothetical protein
VRGSSGAGSQQHRLCVSLVAEADLQEEGQQRL